MKVVAWKHWGFQQEGYKGKSGSKSWILAEAGLELTPPIFPDIASGEPCSLLCMAASSIALAHKGHRGYEGEGGCREKCFGGCSLEGGGFGLKHVV